MSQIKMVANRCHLYFGRGVLLFVSNLYPVLRAYRIVKWIEPMTSREVEGRVNKLLLLQTYWSNMPKVRIYQELKKQVEDLKQQKERIILDKEAKEEADRKAVEEFKKSVVKFAKMALIYQKNAEVVANNK